MKWAIMALNETCYRCTCLYTGDNRMYTIHIS